MFVSGAPLTYDKKKTCRKCVPTSLILTLSIGMPGSEETRFVVASKIHAPQKKPGHFTGVQRLYNNRRRRKVDSEIRVCQHFPGDANLFVPKGTCVPSWHCRSFVRVKVVAVVEVPFVSRWDCDRLQRSRLSHAARLPQRYAPKRTAPFDPGFGKSSSNLGTQGHASA